MRILMTVLAICCLALPIAAATFNQSIGMDNVRELDLKEVYPNARGLVEKPIVIASAADMRKRLDVCPKGDGTQRLERLIKGVDFEKEQVLFFAWAGSPEDKLTVIIDGFPCKAPIRIKAVQFQYQRAMTTSEQPHFRLFVLPKKAHWSVAVVKSKTE